MSMSFHDQWISHKKASFLYYSPEQPVEQPVDFLVIRDAMMLMWCHCNMMEEMCSIIGGFGVKSKWQSWQRFKIMANNISCNFQHWFVYHRMINQVIACMWGIKLYFVYVYVVMIKFPSDYFIDAFCSVLMTWWHVPNDKNHK